MKGTKHAKAIEDVSSKKGYATLALLTRQKGKPSTSSKGVSRNQRNLFVLMVKFKQIYKY